VGRGLVSRSDKARSIVSQIKESNMWLDHIKRVFTR